jgi:hypothetical protein
MEFYLFYYYIKMEQSDTTTLGTLAHFRHFSHLKPGAPSRGKSMPRPLGVDSLLASIQET